MENATPKSEIDISIPKNKKERVKKLLRFDRTFLEKTLLLLNELKRAGVGIYKINENEIRGLKNDDISLMLSSVNHLYRDFQLELPKHQKFITEEVFKDGKLVKAKIEVGGDIMNFPVFFCSGFHEGEGRYPERTFMIGPQFETALDEIEEVLGKNKKKKKLNKIKGLVKPIKWDEITIIYIGDSVKIKQNDTALGEYNLKDLGMPKIGKNKMEGVRQFFTSLFFPETYENNIILSSKNNTQQKLKSNLSRILKDVFETNRNPIQINKKNHTYYPVFKISMGKDLNVNDFSSGREFRDTDKAHYDTFPD